MASKRVVLELDRPQAAGVSASSSKRSFGKPGPGEMESPHPHPLAGHVPTSRRRPSSAGNPSGGPATHSSQKGSMRDVARPETAPVGPRRARLAQQAATKEGGNGRAERKARGTSARAVEKRLSELRGNKKTREDFLKKVDGILAGRTHKDRLAACSGTGLGRAPRTRKSVCLLLERSYPLDTERKADLVELLTSAGLEANRATQTLLDPKTKALLTLRASEGRRARQAQIRDLVSSCEARRRDRQNAARATQMANEKTIEARRERLRHARGRAAGAKGWIAVLKLHAATAWLVRRLNENAEIKKQMAAAEVITRYVATVARFRYDLRVEAATRLIDDRFAKQIRRWKTKRDTDASTVLIRFLSDVRSSAVVTRVKLLAYRVAHAHVQLARLQRWWRRTRREMSACRLVLIRLWEKEVDRRVDAKVDGVWRSQQERSLPQDNGEGPMRWAIRLHPPSSPGGSREASLAKSRVARLAREDQARSEKATIRSHLLLDPLINPPTDVKTRMCGEYLKQMSLRHVRAVKEYVKTVNHMADVHMGTARRVRGRGGLLAVSLAVQAGRNVMKQKGTQITQVHERPRWRTGATAQEMEALVDAGVEFVSGLLWMWKPSTPSRLKDGTLLADSMPSPEELSANVSRKFRYNGGSVMRFKDDAIVAEDHRTWDIAVS